ncbi:hypothetical protein HII28_13355 [Planctomonas sp. JC2975]|uniref:hypothetical protein n=1 Tax=Planctomonas sp. JC2975 TaxID=2729626 RepID=UPI0014742CD9|nr:hypothetical protein [Planctomonas sp. JC2975]NNC12862.1 hypothetical protein [Planctomonas sp. JC2975]
MQISSLDTYDVSDEVTFPVYRVTFWLAPKRPSALESSPYPMAFNAERYRVTGARDVHEVLKWATNDGRHYELFIELPTDGADGVGVVRLAGFNPATAAYARPADYLSDATLAASTVAWIRAQEHDI